jgi:hypothetical protein
MNRQKLIRRIKEESTVAVVALPETEGPEGFFATGDDRADAATVADILDRMEYNDWAWCVASVSLSWNGLRETEYLGACSYSSRQDFIENSGYYLDMVHDAAERIADEAEAIARAQHEPRYTHKED